MLGCLILPQTAWAAEAPDVTASSAILIEASTGRVLYEKDAEELRYPASTTKMMTCILALEEGNLEAVVTVSPAAAAVEDTELKAGEQLRLSELLQEMMLRSDNGAAIAVEEYLASSMGTFAQQMNKKAAAVGARNTHFVNPNGLPDTQHYSTAHDIARITAYGMRNPAFRALVGVKAKDIHWLHPQGKTVLVENTNELLGRYPGLTGAKTGFTKAAGGCLAASAKRDGVELIAVVLHSSDMNTRFQDAAALLDYGFPEVKLVRGIARDEAVQHVWVSGGRSGRVSARPAEDVMYPLLHGEDAAHYSVRYEMSRALKAGVSAGQQVGSLIICYDRQEVDRVPMFADQAVEPGFSLLGMMVGMFRSLFGSAAV